MSLPVTMQRLSETEGQRPTVASVCNLTDHGGQRKNDIISMLLEMITNDELTTSDMKTLAGAIGASVNKRPMKVRS